MLGGVSVFVPRENPYQYDPVNGEEHLEPGVEEEGDEQAEAVVSQVLEGQLEDVAPAYAPEVDFLCGSVSSSTHCQELRHLNNEQPFSQHRDAIPRKYFCSCKRDRERERERDTSLR